MFSLFINQKILSSTNFTPHADKAFLVLEVNPEIALGWMEQNLNTTILVRLLSWLMVKIWHSVIEKQMFGINNYKSSLGTLYNVHFKNRESF